MVPADSGFDPEAFADDRAAMVRHQLENRGIRDQRLLTVMGRVPRHLFVPARRLHEAYEDRPLEIGSGQTISQPYMVAKMTELLAPTPRSRVLEVGAGSGYQAAVLAELAAEVISMERCEELAQAAALRLDSLGYDNVAVVVGDGTLGWSAEAPYDAILVTAGGPCVPESLREQLAVGGRLVCPVGSRELQQLTIVERNSESHYTERTSIRCVFVPLMGREGWSA